MSAVIKYCKGCGIQSSADGHYKHCAIQHNPEWVERPGIKVPECGSTEVHPSHIYDGHMGCRGRPATPTKTPLEGPFSLEDVADGVPGAAEGLAEQATEAKKKGHNHEIRLGSHYCPDCQGSGSEVDPKAARVAQCPKCLGSGCNHHPSQKKDAHCALCEQDEVCTRCAHDRDARLVAQDAAREVDESLDSPHDSKARQKAIEDAANYIGTLGGKDGVKRALEGLALAYDAGVNDTARLINVQMMGSDPMDGAIERAKHRFSRDAEDERDLALALNEAYRNGMRQEQKAQASVKVDIFGLKPEKGVSDYWLARRLQVSNANGTEFTVYRIEGDPNAVAVGRFKASLRKFLGLS